MTLVGRAVLPTAVALFEGASEDTVRALRAAVDFTLTALPRVDSFVLLAAGHEALVHDASGASLSQRGLPDVRAELRHDEELLGALTSRGQIPRVRDDWLAGDLAALALLVSTVQPDACVQPVTVPRGAGRQALEATAAGIIGAARATQRRIALVASGDLARRRGADDLAAAIAWDQAAVTAVAGNDLDAFSELGPAAATVHGAAGWAPLTVLLTAAAGRAPFPAVEHHVVDGAGRLVASEAATA
ncbi:hypothetical protein [Egicoccus sp. AB-alg2]|uniref:hypothetical protein n=1 Tax=Egicoccus sp. AB-alg2 TaxID=3242693 RepID=UPI00359E04E9